MSELRHRSGDAASVDPEGEDFAAQFDREFGPPEGLATAPAVDAPPTSAPPAPVPDGPGGHRERDAGADDVTAPTVAVSRERSSFARAGARIIRRPYGWFKRPWPDDRVIRLAVTVSSLVVTTFIMTRIVHLDVRASKDLIFDDVTPTGGDMGSHVWAPAYLRDNLLSNFQLSGWSMDWYGGLPVYRFYMVIPALAIVALDTVVPYGVAFKIVAVFGLVSLPLMCWAFGRLARFRYPMPELFAFAALCFLLNESTTIYGGNVLATMAGEFSFSIAISLMMLGLGLLARSLEDGRGRTMMWAAAFLALAGLSHGIVLIYTAVGAVVIVACRSGADLWGLLVERMGLGAGSRAERGLVYLILATPALTGVGVLLAQATGVSTVPVAVVAMLPGVLALVVLCAIVGWQSVANRLFLTRLGFGSMAGGLTLLLAAFWVGPFLFDHAYMTDMKYGFKPDGGSESFWSMIFDQEPFLDILITGLAIAGFVISIVRRHVYGIALGITGLISVAMLYITRDSLPLIGLLWNPRILPWIYLMRYLMMMVGAAEVGGVIVNVLRNRPAREIPGVGTRSLIAGATGLVVLVILGFMFQVLPGGGKVGDQYAWGPVRSVHGMPDARSDGWPAYNFRGYEEKPLYPEYHDLVQTMARLGDDPEHGCGRALWEIDNRDGVGNGKYGTTMALMLLPFWTDGCIASMEGLYFEASGTTPYHFLTAAAMSDHASNPVRQLRYTDNDASVGVQYIEDLGIRYVMLTTAEAVAQAEQHPDRLTLVAESGPWHIYQHDAAIVEPLEVQPVVVNGRSGDSRECFLEVATSWFQNRSEWAAMPATGGPDEWQRIDVAIDPERQDPQGQDLDGCGDPHAVEGRRRVNVVEPVQDIEVQQLPQVEVTNFELGQQSVEFDVDQIGVPVLVRVSYFPNWEASGADGPYRIGPNQMVVIPTDEHVELSYERSKLDLFFYGLTIIGIALALVLRFRNWQFTTPAPAGGPATGNTPPPLGGAPFAPDRAIVLPDELPPPPTALLAPALPAPPPPIALDAPPPPEPPAAPDALTDATPPEPARPAAVDAPEVDRRDDGIA